MELHILAFILFLSALGGVWRLPSLRGGMITASLLTVPLFILPFLVGRGAYPLLVWHLLIACSLAALADAFYSVTIRKVLTPVLHPERQRLRWLIAIPIVLIIFLWLTRFNLLQASLVAVLVSLLISAFIRGGLVWDALFSGVCFGLFFSCLFFSLGIPLKEVAGSLELSGLTVRGRPWEEIQLVFLFGMLWGPVAAGLRIIPTQINQVYQSRHQRAKRLIVTFFTLGLSIGGYYLYDGFIRLPQALAATSYNQEVDSLTAPIRITFDRPINRSLLTVVTTPALEGDISFAEPYLQRTFVRQLIFTPRNHLLPGTTYSFHLSHLANLLGQREGEYTYTVRTPALPSVTDTSIKENQTEVAICEPFRVDLNTPIANLAEFTFELSPPTSLLVQWEKDKKGYSLAPSTCLAQSTSYSLKIIRQLTVFADDGSLLNTKDEPEVLKTIQFKTKGAPGVAQFTPQGGGVSVHTKQLQFEFTEAMAASNPSEYISLEPNLAGKWNWQDPKTLIFNLETALTLGKTYQITLKKGLPDAKSGYITSESKFSFSTPGAVKVSAYSPHTSSTEVAQNTPIKITFDQPVEHTSAEQKFAITPVVNGSFSWQGQTMLYSANLQKDTQYTYSLAVGVVSQIGLPLQTALNATFQTEQSVFALDIPVYYQKKPLSCEVASLKMALQYKGVSVDENTLLSNLGADTTPRQGEIWGDPDQTFVGDVNGIQNTTGYGVYASPIASLANQYRSATAVNGISAGALASNLSQGHPVIIWGTLGNIRADRWTTPSGRSISAWVGEHVRLVIGFTGTVDHPTGFILNDPIVGRLRWTTSKLLSNTSSFNGMGVVIY